MSEPTKEALAEAQKLGHDHGCLIEMDCTQEHGDAFSLTTESLARIIARVRTQEKHDALERAAIFFEKEQAALSGDRIVPSRIAADLRAMKVPTDNASGVDSHYVSRYFAAAPTDWPAVSLLYR